jgi:hypothetical protein
MKVQNLFIKSAFVVRTEYVEDGEYSTRKREPFVVCRKPSNALMNCTVILCPTQIHSQPPHVNGGGGGPLCISKICLSWQSPKAIIFYLKSEHFTDDD